ncbi:MAG TPA: CinA family protein [Microbacteriaceae bacterium]|nr:CinA family protein [Microbacteriaceae bacterium]
MIERARSAARRLVAHAVDSHTTIAVAESLTGGIVAATIVGVPGTSEVFRGGVVTYQTAVKGALLGVPAAVLDASGPVDPRVAAEMAERVRDLFTLSGEPAGVGLATTGVAGPASQDGHPVGEVYVAVATSGETRVEHLLLTGDRDEIRTQATAAVLELAATVVASRSSDTHVRE